jgi:DNA replication protein DnaC
LGELAGEDSETALSRKLKAYARLSILAIDEIGYLSYDNRYADLLFEIVSRRNLKRSIILTTNLAFSDWGQVFPNASCVVALVDRLVHRAEIIQIKGESYRLKEAKEREVQRKQRRKKKTRRKGRAR